MTTTTTPTGALDLLGADVSGLDDIDQILSAGDANWTAVPYTPTIEVPDLTPEGVGTVDLEVPAQVLVRSDTNGILGVHKPGYVDVQNRQVTEIALEAVGLRPNDAAVSHAGVIRGGAIFFVNIDLGTLFLDPNGANDEIARHLTAFGSHDGSLPVLLSPVMFRVFCANQLPAIRKLTGFKAKHTKNVLDKLSMARDALGIADAAAEQFVKDAEKLIATPANADTVKRIVEKVWKPVTNPTERQATIAANRMNAIQGLFKAPTNAPKVGENMWAVYNAITEFGDHGRGTSTEKRAVASLLPTGHVTAVKEKALAICLN